MAGLVPAIHVFGRSPGGAQRNPGQSINRPEFSRIALRFIRATRDYPAAGNTVSAAGAAHGRSGEASPIRRPWM
ncbi:hypothetical protein V1283_008106 [Bradyrhizobium sp. AZCC 2262]